VHTTSRRSPPERLEDLNLSRWEAAARGKSFRAMHANKDGLPTLEEMQAFKRGNQTISSPAIGAQLTCTEARVGPDEGF
jgi:hypothetical protein